MLNLAKKYFLPTLAVVVFSIVLFVANYRAQTDSATVSPVTNQGSEPASIKAEGLEAKQPVSNSETVNPETKQQAKVQGSTIQKQTTSNQQTGSTNEAVVPVEDQVTLKIETGGASYSYQVGWSEGVSVYEILDQAHTENNFSLKAKWFGGSLNSYYVQGIHGNNCECWEYEVNGKKPSVGASVTKVNQGDIIIWKAT